MRPITSTARREAEIGRHRGDLAPAEDGVRRFHHRPKAGSVGRAVLSQDARSVHNRAWPVDLGQEDGVGPRAGGGDQIRGPPWRVLTVDPDDDFPSAEIALGCGDDLRPRRLLGVGGDGILEIEDQRVGGQSRGLGECFGVRAGHVENAATRTSNHEGLLTTRQEFKDKNAAPPDAAVRKKFNL